MPDTCAWKNIVKCFICVLHYSHPEPTLIVENVVGVMEKVAVERRKEVWSEGFMVSIVPGPQLEEIYQKYSTEEQRIHACADIYVNCCLDSSWTHLHQRLYWENEVTAAKKAKTFIPQTGEGIIAVVCMVTVQDYDIVATFYDKQSTHGVNKVSIYVCIQTPL
jgi:hypothetical protein